MHARRVPARHGALWVIAGFRLFRANPPLLTALTMGFMFVALVINLLPLIGPFLLPLALPALNLIVANGCRAVERRTPIGQAALKSGLERNGHHLLRLGGMHLLGSLLVLLASYGLDAGLDLAETDRANPAEMVMMMTRLLALAIPVIMALWFSPLLTGWDAVRESWHAIFANTQEMRFTVSDVQVVQVGDLGWVTCTENILSDVRGRVAVTAILATNLFLDAADFGLKDAAAGAFARKAPMIGTPIFQLDLALFDLRFLDFEFGRGGRRAHKCQPSHDDGERRQGRGQGPQLSLRRRLVSQEQPPKKALLCFARTVNRTGGGEITNKSLD